MSVAGLCETEACHVKEKLFQAPRGVSQYKSGIFFLRGIVSRTWRYFAKLVRAMFGRIVSCAWRSFAKQAT